MTAAGAARTSPSSNGTRGWWSPSLSSSSVIAFAASQLTSVKNEIDPASVLDQKFNPSRQTMVAVFCPARDSDGAWAGRSVAAVVSSGGTKLTAHLLTRLKAVDCILQEGQYYCIVGSGSRGPTRWCSDAFWVRNASHSLTRAPGKRGSLRCSGSSTSSMFD